MAVNCLWCEPMKRIALDTNMLVAVEKFKVDVFEEVKKMFGRVEFVVPNQVLRELEKLAGEGRATEKAVNVARELMEKKSVKEEKVNAAGADEALEKLAREGAVVATNDKVLRKKIKEFGKVIYLRKGKIIAEG